MTETVKSGSTDYVVMVCADNDWMMAGTYTATSRLDAVKRAVSANGGKPDGEDVVWVAVPVRFWQPMRRNVEQVTKETWS